MAKQSTHREIQAPGQVPAQSKPKARTTLQAVRKAKGLTQEKMAEMLGISLRHYKYIESGQVLGAIWIWDRLEDIFNVHQRALRENHLDKEDSPKKHQECQLSGRECTD